MYNSFFCKKSFRSALVNKKKILTFDEAECIIQLIKKLGEETAVKNKKSIVLVAIVAINILGIVFLAYFLIPYLLHDTSINEIKSNIQLQAWDSAGLILTIGFIPLAAANFAAFFVLKKRHESKNILFFIPSFICFMAMMSYISATMM